MPVTKVIKVYVTKAVKLYVIILMTIITMLVITNFIPVKGLVYLVF